MRAITHRYKLGIIVPSEIDHIYCHFFFLSANLVLKSYVNSIERWSSLNFYSGLYNMFWSGSCWLEVLIEKLGHIAIYATRGRWIVSA